MDIISDMGIGIPKGLKPSDKQRLVDIANEAIVNQDSIKTTIVNTVNTNLKKNLLTNSTWNTINDNINANDVLNNRIIQLSDLDPYYETIQGTSWSKTVEGNITHIKVNTLTDLSVIVSDDLNNLYKFDTNGNQLWKTNVAQSNLKLIYIDVDINDNIYLSFEPLTNQVFDINLIIGLKIDKNSTINYKYHANTSIPNNHDFNNSFVRYNKINNCIFIIYCGNDDSSSPNQTYWDVYDLNNNLLSSKKIIDGIQYALYETGDTMLSTKDLIIAVGGNNGTSIVKYNYNGEQISIKGINDSGFAYNVIDDNNIMLFYEYNWLLMDSNFNTKQNGSMDMSTSHGGVNYPTRFFNNNCCICQNNLSPNYLSMLIKENDNIISKSDKQFIVNKLLPLGQCDYDNKYLYYSKDKTNILSKITFDNNIISYLLNSSSLSNYNNIVNLYVDDNNNIYIIVGSEATGHLLLKFDNNLNLIYNINLASLFGEKTGKYSSNVKKFFIVNNYIYIIDVFDSPSQSKYWTTLYKLDLNGNFISYVDNINGMYNSIFEIDNNNNVVAINHNSFVKLDLNGNIIFSISINLPYQDNYGMSYNYIQIDKSNNIYLNFTNPSTNTCKFDTNGNLIFTVNLLNEMILDINNTDGVFYATRSDDYYNLYQYNASGSFTGKKISLQGGYNNKKGFIKNGLMYFVSDIANIYNNNLNPTNKTILGIVVNEISNNNMIFINSPFRYLYQMQGTFSVFGFDFILNNNNEIITANVTQNINDLGQTILTKIPAIKNTNSYQIFKGYKLKPIQ